MSRPVVEANVLTVLLATVGVLLCAQDVTSRKLSFEQIANRILATYARVLPNLPPDKQKHFCLRMYRLTGDTAWVRPVVRDLRNVVATLQSDRDSLSNAGYYRRRIDSLTADLERETRKNRIRRALFDGRDSIRLQLDWLYKLATIDDYQITDSTVLGLTRETKDGLQVKPLVKFLLDTQTISVYAAQAANAVEYLRQLELTDIRNEFRSQFREVFPDGRDGKLDDNQFGDKVYGLTHIVISASGYYQQTLDRSEYGWVLNYFSLHQKRILKRLSADIIAEVGLCFLLCNDAENPLVDLCRREVAERFNAKAGLIISSFGSDNREMGEHRNILAIMLFLWNGRLFTGPPLDI